eukprot:CAMPEP_0206392914 /NCGR_PEP_ID=MMETSP0294-20121207/20324_1 /ASSEMBLY_ACC=CAM_ASM_000327 /TAXON_ID=39354 /ORGANISM="Heterosigma akashiwo, Strain CCMP2393" /LENGTH=233 /DNA_ID=CAMNT_0053846247 /DNA_START=42 /DNA_END=739 /DNA_ORIENTATION=+
MTINRSLFVLFVGALLCANAYVIMPTTRSRSLKLVESKGTSLKTREAGVLMSTTEETDRASEETVYCKCSKCTAIYPIDASSLGEKGRKVRCAICMHEWFQARDRLQTLWEGYGLEEFPQEDIESIRERVASGGMRRERKEKGEFTLFLGNLPFNFDEDEVSSMLESEEIEGIVSISVATDAMGRSKGFGFVEMQTAELGKTAMETLSDLNIEGRPLSVREGTSNSGGGGRGG